KDMVTAVETLKDQELRGNFIDANRRAATALSDFASWLEKDKLPKATPNFALGEAKYQRWLTETELVDLPPAKILEIGLAKQKEEWLTSFNYYTTDVTSIHEAYPGHYVQFLRLNASSANKIEKIFGSYAFIEGWAHYCEQMMLDEGFGGPKKPPGTAEEQKRAAKYRMAQASEALLRLCRLCI